MPSTRSRSTSAPSIAYAVRELGRRAGAGEDDLARWRIEIDGTSAVLFPDPASDARVVFPLDRTKPSRIGALSTRPMSRYEWMRDPGERLRNAIPDLCVPFEDQQSDGPLFTVDGPRQVRARGDVVTATLWMLSRVEEVGSHERDEHGRYLARASVSYRNGVLERPIVDEYGLAFEQALQAILPGWRGKRSPLRVKLSHDIDRVGYPRSPRSTAALLGKYHNPRAFASDALALAGVGIPVYLRSIDTVANISKKRGLDSAFYFKAALRATAHDSGYDFMQPQIRAALERVRSQGFEIGLHPGYETYRAPAALAAEIRHLRRIVGNEPIGGRQHYLRWDPQTWIDWEKAGLAYDSSVGYAEAMGFRAGTSHPYHPWSIEEDRELALLEIPLIVMDCTPLSYMRLDADTSVARVGAIVERCRTAGGVFTLLWHNASVIEHPYAPVYSRLLDVLGEHERYAWRDAPPSKEVRPVVEPARGTARV